jgi:hypothetical protein
VNRAHSPRADDPVLARLDLPHVHHDSMLDAIYARKPCPEFQRRVRIHPTVSELLPTVLEDLSPLV